jgi:CheY-like chemotaxis protein
LPKPFTPEHLREAVARQLSEERSLVLVVGDDEMLRRLVIETLARDGGDLREAADGLEALALIAARQPDVLVVDLPNPGPDGFADVKQLLDHPETRGLSVIVLSGHELSVSQQRFLTERSVALMHKGEYSGDQLRRLIQHAPSSSPRDATIPPAADLLGSPRK